MTRQEFEKMFNGVARTQEKAPAPKMLIDELWKIIDGAHITAEQCLYLHQKVRESVRKTIN